MNKTIQYPQVCGNKQIDYYYSDSDGERFIRDIIENEEYKEVFMKHIIIDLGASYGTFSLYAYNWCDTIYAIEPLKICYDSFKETIEKNNLSKIKLFNLALSNYEGKGFMASSNSSGGSCLSLSGQEVNVTTLSKFIKQNEIIVVDLLKIDVEGAEKEIFSSLDFVEIAYKIKSIIGELHGTDIMPELIKNGYRYTTLPGNHFLATR